MKKTLLFILLAIFINACTNSDTVKEDVNNKIGDSTIVDKKLSENKDQNFEVSIDYKPFPELFKVAKGNSLMTNLLKDMDHLLKDNGKNLRNQDNIFKYIHTLMLFCHHANTDDSFIFLSSEKYYDSLRKIGIIPEEGEGGFLEYIYNYDFLKPFIEKYISKKGIYAKLDSLCNKLSYLLDTVVIVKPYLDFIALYKKLELLEIDPENCMNFRNYLEIIANITDVYKCGDNYYIGGLNSYRKIRVGNFNEYISFCKKNKYLVYGSYLDSVITNISEINLQDSVIYVVTNNSGSGNNRFDKYNEFDWYSRSLPHKITVYSNGVKKTIMCLSFYSDSLKADEVFKNTSIYEKKFLKINLKELIQQ